MSTRICIQLPQPTAIDPLFVLDAVRTAQRPASLSPGPGIRLRVAGRLRRSIDVASHANQVLVRTPPHPSRDEVEMLHEVASAISSRYRGHVITSLTAA